MLEDVTVVCSIAVVFCSVTWLVVNGTVDESLWPLFVNECVVVILAVVPPVTVGECGGAVSPVIAKNPIVVSFVVDVTAGKNTEKIQFQLMYHYNMHDVIRI